MRRGRIEPADDRHFRTLFELGAAGTLSDGQLLERFAARGAAGAELAFAALVERHGSMVLRVARSVLRDEHSAHDAFQATFLILARRGPSLWVRDSIGPWLHGVAWRVASQGRLAEGRRRRAERSAARPEAASRPVDDLAHVLHEEIARLPDPYRSAVVACHLEGLTHHDAARRLGWPVGTLQSRLDRARRKLRDRLARRGYAPTLLLPLPSLRVPDALIHATARLAAASAPASLAGPAVLALMGSATKGFLMTPWKIAAATLAIAGSLAASGLYLGHGQTARATEGPPIEAPQAPASFPLERNTASDPTNGDPPRHVADVDIHGFKYPAPAGLLAAAGHAPGPQDDTIPRPAEGPGFPVLLEFQAGWSAPCVQMRPTIETLIRSGYPVKSMDIDRFGDVAGRFRVTSIPTFVVVDGSGAELARREGVMSARDLARFYNANRNKDNPTIQTPIEPSEPPEPGLTTAILPKPWETPVRIKLILSEKEWGFGSGTIIRSTPEESIILTSAHAYRPKDGSQASPVHFRTPIRVDLFNGALGGPRGIMVGLSEKDIPGELFDADFANDVALLRIRPGRVLPASPVVPTSWAPRAGMEMIALGCSHGNDATAWTTTILDPRVEMTSHQGNRQQFFEMKCANEPMEGRSGGGLFTRDGYLAGVCDFADPNEHAGLYAVPEAIHKLLDRNGLSAIYEGKPRTGPPAHVVDPKRWEVQTFSNLNPYLKRLDIEPEARANPVPRPSPPVSDTDRRLADLERKLDRVVEALDNLGTGKKPEGPIGDFGKPPRSNR